MGAAADWGCTIVRERVKTGRQSHILYSLQLPRLMRDFLEVTSANGAGKGESLNRLPVARHELILAGADYCSIAGIDYVRALLGQSTCETPSVPSAPRLNRSCNLPNPLHRPRPCWCAELVSATIGPVATDWGG